VLGENGKLIPVTKFGSAAADIAKTAAEKSKDYIRRHWKYHKTEPASGKDSLISDSADFLERIQSHSLCISGMAFQDAWNVDLERLQRCCIHVISPKNGLIPFCAYYLTDFRGRRFLDYGPPNS